jgi:hypothetical protein
LKPGQKKRLKSALARKRARKKHPRDGEWDRNPSQGRGAAGALSSRPVRATS